MLSSPATASCENHGGNWTVLQRVLRGLMVIWYLCSLNVFNPIRLSSRSKTDMKCLKKIKTPVILALGALFNLKTKKSTEDFSHYVRSKQRQRSYDIIHVMTGKPRRPAPQAVRPRSCNLKSIYVTSGCTTKKHYHHEREEDCHRHGSIVRRSTCDSTYRSRRSGYRISHAPTLPPYIRGFYKSLVSLAKYTSRKHLCKSVK